MWMGGVHLLDDISFPRRCCKMQDLGKMQTIAQCRKVAQQTLLQFWCSTVCHCQCSWAEWGSSSELMDHPVPHFRARVRGKCEMSEALSPGGIKVSLLSASPRPSGIAGMVAQTTIAPVDRMKILLQAQNEHYKHLSKSKFMSTPPSRCLRKRALTKLNIPQPASLSHPKV